VSSGDLNPKRNYWLQVTTGHVNIDELTIEEGDGIQISNESDLTLISKSESNLILFDLK
jgi:redox-sensitive bicupin YhaK (pirin superfamily)